ncbi:hypothetical protein [Chryseobacterium oncorhynchi]|uniref:Uncharacterized protein n=1 Tax=Chryseobacterium oncorhynchi TaxID=741074 RepID=A0A316WJ20_9FLAO|nr:hypothetical protein [Chryseobacterium oncorhynchi]PWN59158.1 hypothetical protein C1638_021925 [Chryseobacterium oncorhynchi]
MNRFTINAYNVVTNPNEYVIFEKNNIYIRIRTAKISDKWIATTCYQFMPCYSGYSSLPSTCDKKYNTEKEAFLIQLDFVKQRLIKEDKINFIALPYIDSAVTTHFPSEIQLSLF